MSESHAETMGPLIQADLDGELDPARAAELAAHVPGCPECLLLQQRLADLSLRLRAEATYHRAPARLQAAVAAQLAASGSTAPPQAPSPTTVWHRRLRSAVPFGAGFALAAALAFLLILPRGPDMARLIVDDHLRALQPGHLTDVLSTDQHTVKPWFDGRLDFAPPVRDFARQGFPLIGGRLDYVAGRPVAVLIYGRARHVIDVFVWPGSAPERSGSRRGYNFVRWSEGGMVFWAVSDLEIAGLRDFVRLWQTPGA